MGFAGKLGRGVLGRLKLGDSSGLAAPQELDVPFISSGSVVYAPYVQPDYTEVPFIASRTVVRSVVLWRPSTAPGNGGELFDVQLTPSGVSHTVQLAAGVTASSPTLTFVSAVPGLLADTGFCVTVDSEVIYVRTLSGDGLTAYGLDRGISNTTPASHSAGANATWDDTYLMAIRSETNLAHEFTDGDSTVYPGWLIAFDSTQAYLSGDRYPAHVDEMVGVFDAGTGVTGANKLDASQPSKVSVAAGTSEDCPAGLTNPARISTDISVGDVGVVRYTNIESSVLVLVTRTVGLQGWYALKRVDSSNVDVTYTDTTGNVIDGVTDGEFNNADYITATLPGTDRTFTYGPPRYSDKGWPIGLITVRQGHNRIPLWTSPDWHNFNFVYAGFDDDATFAQVVINRNGILYGGPEPSVSLPGPQDISGPNATWDDPAYYTSTVWYVGIFEGPYVFAGPALNGGGAVAPPPTIVPVVNPGGSGGGGPGSTPPDETLVLEGGSGGDIPAPQTAQFAGVFFEGII